MFSALQIITNHSFWISRVLFAALHAFNAALVAILATRIWGKKPTGIAWAAAFLFLAHPTMEPMLWISCMFDVTWVTFALLAMIHVWHERHTRPLVPWPSLVWAFLGLFSKESALVIPVLIAFCLIARWRKALTPKYVVFNLMLFFLVYFSWFLLRALFYEGTFGYAVGDSTRFLAFFDRSNVFELSFSIVRGQTMALGVYLGFPYHQRLGHPFPGLWVVVAVLGTLMLLSALAIFRHGLWRRWEFWLCTLAVVVCLAPASHLLHGVSPEMENARWAYGPRVFLCIGLAGLWAKGKGNRYLLTTLAFVWALIGYCNGFPYRQAGRTIAGFQESIREAYAHDKKMQTLIVISNDLDSYKGAPILRNAFRQMLTLTIGREMDGGIIGMADGSLSSWTCDKLMDLPPDAFDGLHVCAWNSEPRCFVDLTSEFRNKTIQDPRLLHETVNASRELLQARNSSLEILPSGEIRLTPTSSVPRLILRRPDDTCGLSGIEIVLSGEEPAHSPIDIRAIAIDHKADYRRMTKRRISLETGHPTQVLLWLDHPLAPCRSQERSFAEIHLLFPPSVGRVHIHEVGFLIQKSARVPAGVL